MQDIVIIGAGIVGSFLAHDLSKYDLKVTVIDKENDIANGTTMANSAIIHTGYDPEDGTLKSELNVKGAKMYPEICKELKIDYQKCGAYVVACDKEEIKILDQLKNRADKRNIRAHYMGREEIVKNEVNISDDVIKAISFPDTAIIYPWQCAIALMEEAVINGVDLILGEKVYKIDEKQGFFTVYTEKKAINTKVIINAAGCGAEKIANMIEKSPFHITYKKGEYFVLSKQANKFVNHIIYPVPTKVGKGVLAVPTTHGNILLGPNSNICESEDLSTTSEGLEYVRNHLNRIVKNIPYHEVIRSYSGLRPTGNNGDFYIKPSYKNKNIIHLGCIDSPGLASAPAISAYVIQEYIKKCLDLLPKRKYVKRKAPPVMNQLCEKEKNDMVKTQPLYGKIVCKCEKISYQEIVDAIHSPCGAKTIKAIKKRVRPGMGKCQGGFCEIEVAKILSKELNIPLTQVLYDEKHSNLGTEAK